MKNLFSGYLQFREESEKHPITSRIKLQKKEGSKEFSPFTVSKSMHSNLRYLIKAFEDSPNVGVGYTTIDKSGEVEPQLKKKKLYLTGGAVRDHLKGKTPKNYDLVTDATPSEIRMILTQSEAGFVEIKPKNQEHESNSRYDKLPNNGRNKVFYASHWDKSGKELEFTVQINGEEFNLATLSKSPKSRLIKPEKGESAASVEEDSQNRDFTINSLYIPLTTSDGENSDLIDPHGGAHHLKNGEIKAVGDNLEARVAEDPSILLKYMKLLSRYGNTDKIPEKYAKLIANFKDLKGVDKDIIKKEFLSGLEHPDNNVRKYIKTFHNTGLLGSIFPNYDFNPDDMPHDLKGDRWMTTAWILKNRDPEDAKYMLMNNGWTPREAHDIAYLIKMHQWGANKFNVNNFYDMKNTHTGLTKSKINDWMKMSKMHGPEVNAFLNHDDSDIAHHSDGFDYMKRNLSTKKYQDSLNKLKTY